ncbi:hypothetical protein FGO68_gene2250 [Halteria grandinella]|uniref:Cadg domain containing protein n=1 Tax=Halteria grandinella TaxID=5974 RepID=A0A8J8T9A9_HALGN|nr:hypothetical protein FGO68_gene2250 [Halteria grandinella]
MLQICTFRQHYYINFSSTELPMRHGSLQSKQSRASQIFIQLVLLFAAQFLIRVVNLASCPQAQFPMVIGGVRDTIRPNSINYNAATNALALAGKSQDFTMREDRSASDNPGSYSFIYYFKVNPLVQKWAKASTGTDEEFADVVFSADGQYLIVEQVTNQMYLILDALGNLVNAVSFTYTAYYESFHLHNALISSDRQVFLQNRFKNTTTNQYSIYLMRFPMTINAVQPTFILQMNYWSWDTYQIALEFTPNEANLWSIIHEDYEAYLLIQYLSARTGAVIGTPFFFYWTIDYLTVFLKVKNFPSIGDLMVTAICDDYGDYAALITAKLESGSMVYKSYFAGGVWEFIGYQDYFLDLQIRTETNYLVLLSIDDQIVYLGSFDTSSTTVTLTFTEVLYYITNLYTVGAFYGDSLFYFVHASEYVKYTQYGSLSHVATQQSLIFSTNDQTQSHQTVYVDSSPHVINLISFASATKSWKFNNVTSMFSLTKPSVSIANIRSAISYCICQTENIYLTIKQIVNDCDGWQQLTLSDGSILPSNMDFYNTSFLLVLRPMGIIGSLKFNIVKTYTSDGSTDIKEIELIGLEDGCLKLKNSSALQPIFVPLNSVYQYQISAFENNSTADVFIQKDSSSTETWFAVTGQKLVFSSTSFLDLGLHTVKFNLYDHIKKSGTYSLTLTITNSAPVFRYGGPEKFLSFPYKVKKIISFTDLYDAEGHPITITLSSTPFVILLSGNAGLQVYCEDSSKIQIPQTFSITLTDPQPLSTSYTFSIIFTNVAPKFSGSTPFSTLKKIQVNQVISFPLPTIEDDQDPSLVKVENYLPSFIEFSDGVYTIAPKTREHVGKFKFSIELKDDLLSTKYDYECQVTNEPPVLSGEIVDQYALLNNETIYQLPKIDDHEGMPVIITPTYDGETNTPKWAKFIWDTFTFYPTKQSEVGNHTIEISYTENIIVKPKKASFKVIIVSDIAQIIKEDNKTTTIKQPTIIDQVSTKIFAKFQIQSITKTSLLQLKFISAKAKDHLVELIDSSNMVIRIASKNNEAVQYTITNIIKEAGRIDLRLIFSDPLTLSNGITPDVLEVYFNDTIQFSDQGTKVTLPSGTAKQIDIPTQMNDRSIGIGNAIIQGMSGLVFAAIPGGVALNFFLQVDLIQQCIRSMFIQYIWSLLNDLSFLTILTLVSMNVPGIVQMIQNVMLNFIYLDILKTDQWFIPLVFGVEDEEDTDGGLNSFLEQNGFSSVNSIKNLQSSFIYVIVIFLLYSVMMFFILIGDHVPRFQKLAESMDRKLVWNYPIRFFIQQYSPFFFASLLNLYGLRFSDTNFGYILGSVITPIIFIWLAGGTSLIFTAIFIHRDCLDTVEFRSLYGSAIEGLKIPPHSNFAPYFNILYILRWTLTGLIMICLRDYPGLQLQSLFMISIFQQLFNILVQPYEERIENLMNFINEVFVSAYMLILFILTEFSTSEEDEGLTNETRQFLGWALLTVVFLSIFANLTKLAVIIFIGLRKRCQRMTAKVIDTQLQMQTELYEPPKVKNRPKLLPTIREEVKEFDDDDEEDEFDKQFVNPFNKSASGKKKKSKRRSKNRSLVDNGICYTEKYDGPRYQNNVQKVQIGQSAQSNRASNVGMWEKYKSQRKLQ